MLVIDNGKTLTEQKLFVLMSAPAAPNLLRAAGEPLMVSELNCQADVPPSTAYREVKRLHETSLFEKPIMVDYNDGRHVTQYHRTFERMEVSVTGDELRTELVG